VGKISSPLAFWGSKGQVVGVFRQRKLRNHEKRSGLSILGGRVAVMGACEKSSERKVIHREIGNPMDKKPIHFEISKSEIPTK
jgi:hypothetical protein